MDLLDMLNADEDPALVETTERLQCPEEKDFELKENAETQNQSNSGDEGWILNDAGKQSDSFRSKVKHSKDEILADLHNTKIKEGVDADRFVWVRNNWFKATKGGKTQHASNFFPARICDPQEGLLSSWVVDPLPANMVVVEYISAPKQEPATPKFVSVEKAWCVPYNEDFDKASGSPKGKRQATLFETGTLTSKVEASMEKWHINGRINVSNYLGNYYSAHKASLIADTMMKKAQQYLDKAFDKGGDEDAEEDDDPDNPSLLVKSDAECAVVEDSDESDDEGMSSFIAASDPNQTSAEKREKKKEKVTLRPGDWISYVNKMFGTIVHTRIVEIKPAMDDNGKLCNRRLVVENGDILQGEDDIRRMEKIQTGPEEGACDKKNGSKYILIKNFRLKPGRDRSLATIHQAASLMSKKNKIDLSKNEAGASSEKKRRVTDFVDTQSDDDDDDDDDSHKDKAGASGGGQGQSEDQTQSQRIHSDSMDSSFSDGDDEDEMMKKKKKKKKREEGARKEENKADMDDSSDDSQAVVLS